MRWQMSLKLAKLKYIFISFFCVYLSKFYSLKIKGRASETQLQVVKKSYNLKGPMHVVSRPTLHIVIFHTILDDFLNIRVLRSHF